MIPIVFACDEHYIAPTYVTMLSILLNKAEKTNYKFILLCQDGLSVEARQIMERLSEQFEVPIKIISMGNIFGNIKMKIEHITIPTYYRLCLPEILDEEKCIYLDSDIIVNVDLSELYNTDIETFYLAGVLSEGIRLDKIYARELCKRIGLKDVSTYINAGVLIMNLEAIRNDGIMQKWMELAPREFPAQDQDILNLSCYGKIKLINLTYNAMTKSKALVNYKDGYSNNAYTINEVNEAFNKPAIIHYADRIKPWNDKKSFWADYWWNIVNNIADKSAKQYVIDFVAKSIENKDKVKENKIKRKMIRFTQILGIYSYLKKVEDYIKLKKVSK